MTPKSVLFVDSNIMFRELIIPLLEREFPGYTFITASSIKDAALLLEHLAFDLLITDISGLESTGLSMIRQARDQSPGTKAIILTSEMSSFWVHRAIREGVLGIVTKTSSVRELVSAIRAVQGDQKYLSPEIAQLYMRQISYSQIGNPMNLLSPRELEIFVQIGQGRRLKSIAMDLGLSPCTVAVHKHNIARKTGIITTENIARYCLEHGMLGLKPGHVEFSCRTQEREADAAAA